MQRPRCIVLLLCLMAMIGSTARAQPFAIRVIDSETKRGVPMVELTTTSQVTFITDSNGLIAFDEPGLLDNGTVWFSVRSHGYEYPADGFGYRGVRLDPVSGGEATVEVRRNNIAERLYRVTGQGIYAETAKLGRDAPLERPNLNGRVVGQDTVQTVIYRGRLYWFWGDTSRPGYPLGNFSTSGATSLLPGDGGLSPDDGVDLTYFVGEDGFSRPVAPLPGKEGVVWIDSLMVVPDDTGRERLLCRFVRLLGLGDPQEEGLMVWNDEAEQFKHLLSYPLGASPAPGGHPIRVAGDDGRDWFYFARPYVTARVPADWESVRDLSVYESFTPSAAEGEVKWAWRSGASPMDAKRLHDQLEAGKMSIEATPLALTNAATGELVRVHASSVAWNAHRGRWTMIAEQIGGDTSLLGEIWYAEADAIEGPWGKAVKVVTHDDYTFYNPRHHPMLDAEGGRYIYFEATYTKQFSGTVHPTPRYDYNQILYRLNLDDERLAPARE